MTEVISPWLGSLKVILRVFMMTINDKSERNEGGKSLGWPVTSYSPGHHS